MVMRPTKLAKTPPTSRGSSPNRNNGNKKAIPTPTRKRSDSSPVRASPVKASPVRNSPSRVKASPVKASPVNSSAFKASPVRTPPDVEFIIRNSSKQRQLVRSSSNRSSRGTSPAKSENSFLLHSRGSEWVYFYRRRFVVFCFDRQ